MIEYYLLLTNSLQPITNRSYIIWSEKKRYYYDK